MRWSYLPPSLWRRADVRRVLVVRVVEAGTNSRVAPVVHRNCSTSEICHGSIARTVGQGGGLTHEIGGELIGKDVA